MGGAIGKIVGAVVNPIWAISGGLLFKALGIETQEKTITDLQISNLLTPGAADKTARRTLKTQSLGDAKIYHTGYSQFKRDYRKKYSSKFLKSVGYLPTSTATTYRAVKGKTAEYIKTQYGYQYVHIDTVKDGFLSTQEKITHAVRTLAGYDFSTGTVKLGGNEYFISSTNVLNDIDVEIVLLEDYRKTIKAYLESNYISNGRYVFAGVEYEVKEVSDTVVAGNYSVTLYPLNTTLSTLVLNVPINNITQTVTNALYGQEVTYIKYKVLSGEINPYFRYEIHPVETLCIYDSEVLDITAIVPLKENGTVTDFASNNLKRMLNKLNIASDDLENAVTSNADMDSAYVLTGINPQYNDNITNKAMFDLFSYFVKNNGNYSISLSQLQAKYSFSATKSMNSGSIGSVGTITRQSTGSGAGLVMTLSYQNDLDNYTTIVISNFVLYYVVSGYEVTAYLDSGNGYCRLLIPLELLNNMKYKEFVWIYERSLCLLAFSVDVVKIKWYETAGFGTLLKIAAITMIVFSLGTASSLSSALLSIAASTAVAIGASLLAKAIGGPLGAIVGAAAFVLGMVYAPGVPSMGSTDIWLMSATQAISAMNSVTAMKMDELKVDYEAFVRDMKEKIDYLNEQNEEFDKPRIDWFNMFDPSYAGRPSDLYSTVESYCTNATSASVEYLVDYESQIATQMSYRNSVVAGIS